MKSRSVRKMRLGLAFAAMLCLMAGAPAPGGGTESAAGGTNGTSGTSGASGTAGDRTHYTYDRLDRLTRIEYADGATVEYTHDAGGNVTSIVPRRRR